MTRARVRSALVVLAMLAAAACRVDATDTLTINGHEFQVELAQTPEERQRGLMFRDELAPDAGMLFVFPDSELRSFWMKDTSIPLSIAYLSSDGRILEIHDMEPFSREPVRSRYPARFALEVNRGRFEELGIEPGDHVSLPDSIDAE